MPPSHSHGNGLATRLGPIDPLRAAATLLTILPVWVAVLQTGLSRTPPLGDAALTVLRATDVFSSDPPLVGMLAAGASGAGHEVHFPGPWQLYVLAGPTRLFGVVWGPIVAMGALNTVWLLAGCWLLCRRLDRIRSLVGIGFLALFSWSVGSGFLITPVPMDMILVPFAVFLIAAWCVATGEEVALPVLVLLANFLWTSHLVLILLVPVIGACALVGLVLSLRARRAERIDAGDPRLLRRSLVVSAAITVVMWIPPLIQQFTASPGNLRLLLASSGDTRASIGSWTRALHVVISTIARPPFWLRGTVDTPSYTRRPVGPEAIGMLSVFDVMAIVVVAAVMVLLGVAAFRRRDRIGFWALVVAAVAALACVPNTYLAPTTVGFPVIYLRSLQAVAMFVWFAIALNLVGLARGRIPAPVRRSAPGTIVAGIAVLALANLPTGPSGYGTDRRAVRLVRSMNATVPTAVDGPVRIDPAWDLTSQAYRAALALGLYDHDVAFCVEPKLVRQVGRACPDPHPRSLVVTATLGGSPPAAPSGTAPEVIWRGDKLSPEEADELARLDRRWNEWLGARNAMELTDEMKAGVARYASGGGVVAVEAMLNPADGDLSGLQHEPLFKVLVEFAIDWHGGTAVEPFVDAPLPSDDLVRWSRLTDDDQSVTVRLR